MKKIASMLPWHQYILGLFLILAGVNHFRKPKMYERIMPAYIPAHKTLVILSGIFEMILGMMILIPEYQTVAAWGIILMLVVFLTVHFYMLSDKKASMNLPKWVLVLRIPLQFALMWWVFQYT